MEDRRFFDLRKLDIAEPVHQHRDKEHRDNDDVTRTQCMTDFLLKEQHQDDEEHAQKEQAHRERVWLPSATAFPTLPCSS